MASRETHPAFPIVIFREINLISYSPTKTTASHHTWRRDFHRNCQTRHRFGVFRVRMVGSAEEETALGCFVRDSLILNRRSRCSRARTGADLRLMFVYDVAIIAVGRVVSPARRCFSAFVCIGFQVLRSCQAVPCGVIGTLARRRIGWIFLLHEKDANIITISVL